MNYKDKINKPIHTVNSKGDPTFKLFRLSHGKIKIKPEAEICKPMKRGKNLQKRNIPT